MRYFTVKNFERFQHYRDRKPPWVKLYRDLWLDREFFRLQVASKLLFIGLTTLASITENRIPQDLDWIAHNLGLRTKDVDLNPLISAGFLLMEQDASNALADCKHLVVVETEERQRREETDTRTSASAEECVSPEDLMQGWNDLANKHGLSQVSEFNAERQRRAKARLTEHPELEFWNQVFTNIGRSEFLRGGSKPSNGHPNWRCNFDWLISKDTVPIKIFEGEYNAKADG